MKQYIFYGGVELLVVIVDGERNVSIKYPPIFGNEEISLNKIQKHIDRNNLAKYNLIKKNSSDKEFEEYILYEFTHGDWLGFELNKIIEK